MRNARRRNTDRWVWEGSKKITPTGEEFEKDERGQHKRERDD